MTTHGIKYIALMVTLVLGLPLFVAAQTPDLISIGGVTEGVTGAGVSGEIEYFSIDEPNNPFSAGTVMVAGQLWIIPSNLVADLPANRLTMWQMIQQAPPAAYALGETGLCKGDSTVRGRGGSIMHLLGNQMADGRNIAGDMFVAKGLDFLTGEITFINYDEGYFCINGIMGIDQTGTMVRFNDPSGIHSIQSGSGCVDGQPNCTPDIRFGNDPENYTMVFSNGYPMCIPSPVTGGARTTGSDANGNGDQFCPNYNREGPVRGNGTEATDSRFQAPLMLGDIIGVEGNIENIDGVSFYSCHTAVNGPAITSRDASDQPSYIIADEVEWDAPGFNNERVKVLLIGFSTLDSSQVDIFAVDLDPANNEGHERLMASTRNNPNTVNHGIGQGRAGIFKVVYDVDFLKGAPVTIRRSPCANLTNAGFDVCPQGGTISEEFALLAPLTRDVQFRAVHAETLDPGVEAYNMQGDSWTHDQYLTPAGIGHPEWDEIDLNRMWMPLIFGGVNWNLDRRLGPGGCLDTNGDEVVDCEDNTAIPVGDLHLDPYPYSGLNPTNGIIGGSNLPIEDGGGVADTVLGEICDNGIDDDGDLAIDCEDIECDLFSNCVLLDQAGGEIGEIGFCGDALDNDGDGLIDCFDPECAGAVDCVGIGAVLGFSFVPTNMERIFGYWPMTYEDTDGDPLNGAENLVTMIPFTDANNALTSYALDLKPAAGTPGILPGLIGPCQGLNADPVAALPGAAGLPALPDTAVIVAESDIATDSDGDHLTITFSAGSDGGTLALIGADYVYTPTIGFVGNESFTFTATDAHGGATTGTLSFQVAL
ncbi:MAG: Ig-like domain-containing protein [Planctomycetota bacterium]|nr:Ig-like domain-containing protein [Planctomycetota bacterium]